MNDMSLILEFVQEAREYIDEIEPTLIELNQGSDELGEVDPELINAVFRLFHSMKGSAGFLSLTTVVGVTHEAETLLDKIRQGKQSLTVQITETLCKALDLFREMLEQIAETGQDDGWDVQAKELIGELKSYVEGKSPAVPPTPAKPAKPAEPAKPAAPAALPSGVPTDLPPQCKISPEDLAMLYAAAAEEEGETPAPEPEKPAPQPTESNDGAADGQHEEITGLQIAPEMRQGFVQEAVEQIDAAEQALLLVLDESQDSAEPLKDAFRYIHSFKGNCGFMGIKDLEKLSHSMETLLDGLRNGEIAPEEKNIGKLLSLLDVLRDGVQSVDNGGNGQIKDMNYHIRALNAFMGQDPGAAPKPPSVPESSKPKAPALKVSDVLPDEHDSKKTSGSKSGGGSGSGKGKQDIRVDLGKLDLLINLVGELVIAESMVTRCEAVAHVEDEYFNRAKHQLRRICDEIKDVAMSVRMIPLSTTFRKMIRLVHDLATKSGKKIKLNLIGEDTEVDKTVIEQIADPLVHIVRNSCDHGVELPDERIKAGKSDTGTVNLEGRHEGGEVWILITDDGRGLNKDKIAAKAVERGLVGPEIRDWPDEKIFRLVFEPGFSTADKVTDISGRGVGMDVVKRNIEKLNGRIDIQSKLGKGSTFTLRIPLTLAIVDAMLVRVGSGKYMIPTLAIRESLVPLENQVTVTPDGREILRIREEMIPIIRLYDVFGQEPGSERLKDGVLMVGEDSGRSFAFFVDEIIGQQQTVIKGLPDYIGKTNGFSGCTILGDGTVSLIIDVGVVSHMTGSFSASPVDKARYWDDSRLPDAESHSSHGGWGSHDDFSFEDLEAKVREHVADSEKVRG